MLFDIGEPAVKTKEVLETPKQKMKREWAEIRSATNEFLAQNEGLFESFRERLTALFEAMREDKEPFTRRPNISLRLIASGSPLAKLITLPHMRHDATGGYLVPARHAIELMEQKPIQAQGKDAVQFQKKMDFENVVGKPRRVNYIYKSALDDAHRVIATIRDFLDDSRAVLARGCDHCCICGRGLTDELSRSRGIGPECIKSTNIVAILVGEGRPDPAFIVPETA
jgi:hypothetical protein